MMSNVGLSLQRCVPRILGSGGRHEGGGQGDGEEDKEKDYFKLREKEMARSKGGSHI